jgi:cysteine dioxygenase
LFRHFDCIEIATSKAAGEGSSATLPLAHGILNGLSDTSMTKSNMGTTEGAAQPRVPIEELVRKLRALPASAFDETEKVRLLLANTPVEEGSLARYLVWDRQHYTRNLIDKTDLYELMAICWEVGQSSSVHNHRDQNCWMAAPVGKLLVENFDVGFQDIEAGKARLAASNTVELTAANPCAVDPREPVHRVINPREANQRAVTLHVYSRPFDTCVVYSPEQGTCGDIKLHYTTAFGKPVAR